MTTSDREGLQGRLYANDTREPGSVKGEVASWASDANSGLLGRLETLERLVDRLEEEKHRLGLKNEQLRIERNEQFDRRKIAEGEAVALAAEVEGLKAQLAEWKGRFEREEAKTAELCAENDTLRAQLANANEDRLDRLDRLEEAEDSAAWDKRRADLAEGQLRARDMRWPRTCTGCALAESPACVRCSWRET